MRSVAIDQEVLREGDEILGLNFEGEADSLWLRLNVEK